MAIHAAKNDEEGREVCTINSFYREALTKAGVHHFDDLPLGVVLCVVDLVDVVGTGIYKGIVSQKEEQFGDWSSGRWAWRLSNLRVLVKPIPYRGMQGFWEWPVELKDLEFKP